MDFSTNPTRKIFDFSSCSPLKARHPQATVKAVQENIYTTVLRKNNKIPILVLSLFRIATLNAIVSTSFSTVLADLTNSIEKKSYVDKDHVKAVLISSPTGEDGNHIIRSEKRERRLLGL